MVVRWGLVAYFAGNGVILGGLSGWLIEPQVHWEGAWLHFGLIGALLAGALGWWAAGIIVLWIDWARQVLAALDAVARA